MVFSSEDKMSQTHDPFSYIRPRPVEIQNRKKALAVAEQYGSEKPVKVISGVGTQQLEAVLLAPLWPTFSSADVEGRRFRRGERSGGLASSVLEEVVPASASRAAEGAAAVAAAAALSCAFSA